MRAWAAVFLGLVLSVTALGAPVGAATAKTNPAWSAAKLLHAVALGSVSRATLTRVEDDGGVPLSSGGQGVVSSARALTQSGVELDASLYSTASPAAAKVVYQQLSSSATLATPISAGDEAVYADGKAYVLKKAQVLEVDAKPGAALEQQLSNAKANGGDPTAQVSQIEQTASAVAPALAATLKGTPATKSVLQLPAGAIDPCSFGSAKSLAKALGVKSATAGYAPSDNPPAMTCQYALADEGGAIGVSVVTDAQLGAALSPATVANTFAKDKAAADETPSQITVYNPDDPVHSTVGKTYKINGKDVYLRGLPEGSTPKDYCEGLVKWFKTLSGVPDALPAEDFYQCEPAVSK